MRIIITGPKCSGKSTIGRKLSAEFGIPFYDTDEVLEEIYFKEKKTKKTFREIFNTEGEPVFRDYEKQAIEKVSTFQWCIISTGGGTILNPDFRKSLFENSIVVLLKATEEVLWSRITNKELPEFYKGPDGRQKHQKRYNEIFDSVSSHVDILFNQSNQNEEETIRSIKDEIVSYMNLRMFSPSTFGEIIRVTTFGESHGKALGVIMDGLKPGVEFDEKFVQEQLNRRRPGQSKVTTPRNESDSIQVLSGVFEGKTTGTPICMVVFNKDQDSTKYDNLKDIFRPGHADFTFWKKYGFRDHRGGGRSSGRETIGRVASGAVALKILKEKGIEITAFAEEINSIKGVKEDFSYIEKNPVRSACPDKAKEMEEAIVKAGENKDSVGGIVKIIVKNLPAGIGDPVFYKLDARLASAWFSLGAVKGVEIGDGFSAARKFGSENNDSMNSEGFITNHAGGILGGISNGQDIIGHIAVKPTPSIFKEQATVDTSGSEKNVTIAGRHDPCIVPRIIPVVESMTALVILDALEIQNRLEK